MQQSNENSRDDSDGFNRSGPNSENHHNLQDESLRNEESVEQEVDEQDYVQDLEELSAADTSFASELKGPERDNLFAKGKRLLSPEEVDRIIDAHELETHKESQEEGAQPKKGFLTRAKEQADLVISAARKALRLSYNNQKGSTIASGVLRLFEVGNAYITPVLSGGLVGSVLASIGQSKLTPETYWFAGGLVGYELLSGVAKQLTNYFQTVLNVDNEHKGREGLLEHMGGISSDKLKQDKDSSETVKLRSNMYRIRRFAEGFMDLGGSTLTLGAALFGMAQVSPTAAALLGATMFPLLVVEGRRAKIDSDREIATSVTERPFWPLHWDG